MVFRLDKGELVSSATQTCARRKPRKARVNGRATQTEEDSVSFLQAEQRIVLEEMAQQLADLNRRQDAIDRFEGSRA